MSSPFSSFNCNPDGTWTEPPDGFSYLPPNNAYQFVPVGQSRRMFVSTDHRRWTLSVVDPANSFGGIKIETEAPRLISDLFDIYTLEPMKTYDLIFTGQAETMRILVMSTPGEAERPALLVHAGDVITIHYAVNVIVRDASLSLIWSEPQLLSLLRELEASYARQANIRLVRTGPIHRLKFNAPLGPQIITDGEIGYMIRDHIKAAGRGHLKNLVYGWDFEKYPQPHNGPDSSSGLTVIGGNVSQIDWGNPMLVTAHELGHAIGLVDRQQGDVTIMQPKRPQASGKFYGFDGAQIEALRLHAKRLP